MEDIKLTDKQEIELVLKVALEKNWEIYKEDKRNFRLVNNMMNLLSEEVPDLKNFHIITDKGFIIKRKEIGNKLTPIKHWELRLPDNSIISGNYLKIVRLFTSLYGDN